MGNTIQHKRRNPANCLGCMAQDHETFDPNELQIGLEVDKARGRITQQSTAYLTENEKNFFKAASGRNLGLIRFYLNNGININILDEDRTSPLHIASRYGSIQVVQELINNNANIDITDMAGWTPLHVAAFYQRAQVCSVLLKAGADPKIRNREGNLAQDLVRDKMTSEIFKSSLDIQNSCIERQVKRIDPAQRQHEEYFQFLKQQRLKSQECNSLCEKVSQGKLISPNLSPTKLMSKEKENQGLQDSISKSIISEGNEQKDIQDCFKELSSKISRNLIFHQNSIPRSFDEMYSLNQLVLLQNQSKELVTFLDQVKVIKHDYNSENLALDLFNHSSIIGISFMIATQMIKPTPQSIINWLFQDIELKNKVQISKLLCNINLQEQQQILKLFIDKIVMSDNLIDSLQRLFSKLLVQNDPFILDILVKEFSRRFYEFNYYNSKPQTFPFKSEESLHMFTFALVILDIESDKYDKENAFKCFFQNIQTINNGDNLNSKYIQQIIEQLSSQQIVKLNEQQIDTSLYHVFNNYSTPILLREQKQILSEKWKLYIISDFCILISDGKMKILSSSKNDIIINKQEVTIQGKLNQQLIYFICKDEQTFILKIKNKKLRFINLQ
ncbi:unnamed protein product [Paramecium primaurelia]|uniref:SEC7 domain-containing protein n=1 Tax=Paramecium primaurelia TaxID=5886 RepID=A0A8S1KX33_PARPR|nr:unnamed protein product [Paramecium primaurelia]